MKVLVVEDQAMINDLLSAMCRKQLGLGRAYVCSAFTTAEARTLLNQGGYTLILLDIQLPDANGFDFAIEALRIEPALKIIGVSAYCNDYTVYRLQRSPIHAFINKNSETVGEFWRALRAIDSGRTYYSPSIESISHSLRNAPDSFTKLLSDREITILCRVGSGEVDPQIGEALCISTETVKWHRKQMMHKLGLRNHTDLVLYANRKGFSTLS